MTWYMVKFLVCLGMKHYLVTKSAATESFVGRCGKASEAVP